MSHCLVPCCNGSTSIQLGSQVILKGAFKLPITNGYVEYQNMKDKNQICTYLGSLNCSMMQLVDFNSTGFPGNTKRCIYIANYVQLCRISKHERQKPNLCLPYLFSTCSIFATGRLQFN